MHVTRVNLHKVLQQNNTCMHTWHVVCCKIQTYLCICVYKAYTYSQDSLIQHDVYVNGIRDICIGITRHMGAGDGGRVVDIGTLYQTLRNLDKQSAQLKTQSAKLKTESATMKTRNANLNNKT